MPRQQPELCGLAAVSQGLALLILVLVFAEAAEARTRSAEAAHWGALQPQPVPIASTPLPAQSIPPLTTDSPRIEAPATPLTPGISAPPLPSPGETLMPKAAAGMVLNREIEQLQKTASPASGYGSSNASAQAAWLLGLIYLHGTGVRIDQPLALQWFERAARKGREPWAFAGLAWCAIDGCGTAANPATATQSISRLRAAHPARADFLAWLQAARLKPLQLNTASAGASPAAPERQLLERAAAAGDIQANIELGIQAFASKQTSQAVTYFRRVAARSSVAAENLRIVQSRGQASEAAAPSAHPGSAQFALDMARMYHRGQGVPANYAEALRFYRLAEQRGSSEAHKMIELIFSRPMPNGSFDPGWMQQLARVDLSHATPQIASSVTALQLQREPTPLFDLLPAVWQKRQQAIAP